MKILYSTIKEKWCRRNIGVMFNNEKYTVDIKLLKHGKSDIHYLASETILQ